VGALALICGVTAALGVTQFLAQPAAPQAAAIETTKLPVATVHIKRGDRIIETMITEKDWPKDLAPEGAILNKEELIGKIAQSPLYPTEPFLAAKVGETERFSGLVKKGMRAYTILTPNDASLVAGLITPGDKVDVLFTDRTSQKEFTGGGSTTPLLQNIEVMAVGNDLGENDARQKEAKDMRSVTLAVTLDMATKLALAQQLGTLHLALRSEQDQATGLAAAITLNELMRTMYPALNVKDEVEAAEAEPAVEVAAMKIPMLADVKPLQRKQLVVRTMRGYVPSELVMPVSADGRERFHKLVSEQ
jgi:pilus assembly protein CpaB